MKDIVVMHHGGCPDGVGGAFAAWKKFGTIADYIPLYRDDPLPTELAGKEVYLIDFSFPKEIMLAIEQAAKRLVVLDHHEGVKEGIEAVREHVFDINRSGAGIAWEYFHPGVPLPRLLAYIQDSDLWKRALPDAQAVAAYLGTVSLDFETYDRLALEFENEDRFRAIVEKGKAYSEYAEFLCQQLIDTAEEVEFEGYMIHAVNSGRALHSLLGNLLAKKYPPFSIVWYRYRGMWHFSMRGNGTVDLTQLAQKYGGNGHPNAAAFRLPFSAPMPFNFKK